MKFQVFSSAFFILALGATAHSLLPKPEAFSFLHGALTLGGGLVICGLFMLKMPWHGLIGAGVLAMLGAVRGISNLPDAARFLAGERLRGPSPMLETGVTAICALLLIRTLAALHRERVRRQFEEPVDRADS